MKLKLTILSLSIAALFFYSSSANGQSDQQNSFTYFDSITYQQYISGNWSNLIESGKKGISMGYDSKYLRLRMGIAYFNLKDYRTAAQYMTKTLQFDSYDSIAALYFNLSCQEAGRDGEYYYVPGTKKPYHLLQSIYAEFGVNQGGKIRDSANLTDSVIYKEITYPVSRTFSSFGIGLRPFSKLSVFAGVSKIELKDRKSFGLDSLGFVPDHINSLQYENDYFYKRFFFNKHTVSGDINNQQISFYLNLNYYPWPGVKVTPAINLLRINSTQVDANINYEHYIDTTYLDKFTGLWHTALIDSSYDYTISKTDTSFYDYAFSLAVSKEIGMFTLGINGTYSRMYGEKIYQIGATLAWYSIGNTNFYTISTLNFLKNKRSKTYVFEQLVGGKIYKNGWLEGFVTFGELVNYTEKNAYLVYDQPYSYTKRMGITFYPYVGKHLELMVMFRNQMVGIFYTTSTLGQSQPVTLNQPYSYSSLLTGIKWKF